MPSRLEGGIQIGVSSDRPGAGDDTDRLLPVLSRLPQKARRLGGMDTDHGVRHTHGSYRQYAIWSLDHLNQSWGKDSERVRRTLTLILILILALASHCFGTVGEPGEGLEAMDIV